MKPRTPPQKPPLGTDLRQKVLEDFQALGIPLLPEQLDAALSRAEREGLSHLEFLRVLIHEQANGRRERRIARLIRAAGFAETKTLADFDWQFNAAVIDRVRIETLAGGEFIGRHQNLRPPDLRDFDVEPNSWFSPHRRSSRPAADWCLDR